MAALKSADGTKTFVSCYVKKSTLPDSAISTLDHDIDLCSSIFRKVVCENWRGTPNDGISAHNHHVQDYGITHYAATSIEAYATGAFKAAMEALALDIRQKEKKLAKLQTRVDDERSRYNTMLDMKNSLKQRSIAKAKGLPVPKFKNRWGNILTTKENSDGSLTFTINTGKVSKRNKKKPAPKVFENEYLFELYYVNPYLKERRNQIQLISARIHNLETKIASLKRRQKGKHPRICFGGKKLLRKRAAISSPQALREWQNSFRKARRRELPLVGRCDLKNGNAVVRYNTATKEWTYTALDGTKVVFPQVVFPYGQEFINLAVEAHDTAKLNKKLPDGAKIYGRKPVSVTWTVKDCGNAYQVKCSIQIPENPNMNTEYSDGCIAFDMSYDHLAVAETDANGQLVSFDSIPLKLRGKTSNQRENIISEALECIFKKAIDSKKPIAMEDIKHIDRVAPYGNKQKNRKVSEFASQQIQMMARSKANKYGIAVREVNPAYTSQIGKFKYMRATGLSFRNAAAFVIGRRAMGYSEPVPPELQHLVTPNKPEWGQWSELSKALKKVPAHKFYEKIDFQHYKTVNLLAKALSN